MRVYADVVDNLIDKQENVDSVLSKDEVEQAKKLFEFQIPETTITVEVKGLSQDAAPVIATRPEFMRRMKEMSQSGGGGMFGMSNMPEMYNLVVNANSELASSILQADEATQKELVKNALDLAKLSQGLLKGEELTAFVKKSFDTLK